MARRAPARAGSNSWGNYRHQADVYHAYQIFKRAGLDDDHIVVFHYDDIANDSENPTPGQVINSPYGNDVYPGVPKDYTGLDVTAANFIAALKGDADAVKGGSGKVIASGAKDKVFAAFFDHGGPGILGVPAGTGPYIYANDVNDALKSKYEAGGFKELTFYVEACESGSIFDGLLPANISTYVTTAANPTESSWGYYCPGMNPGPPKGYNTCLGDLYSITWMENVDSLDSAKKETLLEQYRIVKQLVSQNHTYRQGSHVMQYGDLSIDSERLSAFIHGSAKEEDEEVAARAAAPNPTVGEGIAQRDADLHSLYHVYLSKPEGSAEKKAAFKAFLAESTRRAELDRAIDAVGKELLTEFQLNYVRAEGEAVTREWDCYKQSVLAFEAQCGRIDQYGLKHAGVFAKSCNNGVGPENVAAAAAKACAAKAL